MRISILLSLWLLYSIDCRTQDCAILGPIDILAQESTDIVISVSGLINDDLAGSQDICGIRLVFNHNQLENLRISLTSPDGDVVSLVGPGTVAGNLSSLILWDIAFSPCMNPASPDPGFQSQWNNNQAWSSFQTYTGVYHPFSGCLEDFDSGSANGNWTLSIDNLGFSTGTLQYFELIFCNATGNACSDCFLYAGEFSGTYEIFCESDNRLQDLTQYLDNQIIINSNQDYIYLIFEQDSLLALDKVLTNLDTLSPSIYTICGLVYDVEDSTMVFGFETITALNNSLDNIEFCGDITQDCFMIEILESSNTVTIDTLICAGDTLKIRDLHITNFIDTIITVFDTTNVQPFVIECDSIYNIKVGIIDIDAMITSTQNSIICGTEVFLNGLNSQSSFGPITNYMWTALDGQLSGNIGPIVEAQSGGTFILSVSDSRCTDTDTILIMEQDSFQVDLLQEDPLCFDDTLIVNLDFEFQPDSIFLVGPNILDLGSSQFSTLESGQYILQSYYLDCVSSDTINLINDAAPIDIEVSYDTINCLKPFASIEIITNVMNPQIEFSGPENIMDNDLSPEVMQAGEYILTVTDQAGCNASSAFIIIDNSEAPTLATMSINISCNAGEVMLPLTSDMLIDSIQWIGPQGFESQSTNPMTAIPGTYYVEVFASNGCSGMDSLELTVSNETILFGIEGEPLDCETPETMLCIESNAVIDSIAWTLNGSLISNSLCFQANQAAIYSAEIFDENGCFGFQNYELTDLSAAISAIIDSDSQTLYCGNTLLVDGFDSEFNSHSVFTWLNASGDVVQTGPSFQITTAGEYFLEISDTLSKCKSIDSIDVDIQDNPFSMLDFSIEHPLCFGDSGAILIDNYPTFIDFDVFLNDLIVSNQDSFFSLPSGKYAFEFVDENNCSLDTVLNILEGGVIGLDLGEDQTVPLGATVNIDAELSIDEINIVNYNWSNPELLNCITCLNPEFQVNENITLNLEVTDINGCTDSDDITFFTDNTVDFFVPNVFTPDGDGDNDILTIYISDRIQKIFDFQIIDRWGNLLIFHPEIAQEGSYTIWDGSSNGSFAEDGVYVFVAKLLLLDNSEVTIFGNITLLK